MTLPKTHTDERMPVRFILVEPSRTGNIGAAARAMKTMGFSDLVLVNPRETDATMQPEAIAFASGAQDLLLAARTVDTIDAALDGCNFAAAVSARLREFSPPVMTPRAVASLLAEQQSATDAFRPALVFGNERAGLPNQIVERCNVLINIPANPAYSSLNLAQAVQIVAYECALGLQAGIEDGRAAASVDGAPVADKSELAGIAQVEAMYRHLEESLAEIGFLDPTNPRKLMVRLRRLFSRTGLETDEVNILRGIARQMRERRRS